MGIQNVLEKWIPASAGITIQNLRKENPFLSFLR
jgi:hypothetical protein